MAGLTEGNKAPDFKLKTTSGETVTLEDFKGRPVVLYFYPKDMTPGCTQEACDFRDSISRLKKKKAVILGVSPDSVEMHQKFTKKYDLNFSLLADEGAKVAQAYGVWKEKNMYGRKYMGIVRTTFLIDAEGKIKKIYPKVKVDGHVEEVLNDL